jgi:SAM-dependent methyltransferase
MNDKSGDGVVARRAVSGAGAVLQLSMGFMGSRAVQLAVELGIADRIRNGPKSCAVLAAETGAHEPSLRRLLRALVALGVFEMGADGNLTQNALSVALRTDVPHSVNALVRYSGADWNLRTWLEIRASIMTGKPAFEKAMGTGMFEYFAERPEAGQVFDAAMSLRTGLVSAAVLVGYDFSACRNVVDVGGGTGTLLAEILKANAHARGVLLDRAPATEAAERLIRAEGVQDRCEVVTGDFFESIPAGGDLYILKNVLHDWDDAACRTLLARCREVMTHGARLLVVESVLDTQCPQDQALLDLAMLLLSGGMEREEASYRSLFASAGLQVERVIPIPGSLTIMEAVSM